MSRCPEFPHGFQSIGLIVLCLMLGLAGGCGDEEAITDPPAPPSLPEGYPDTPDQLMDNFLAAVGEMDSLAFATLLHPDYRFLFSGSDLNVFELLTGHLTATEELTIAWNMFSGQAIPRHVLNAAATTGAGIASITFVRFDPMDSEWYEPPEDSPFQGTLRRLFNLEIHVERPGATTLQISGQQEFFVVSRDSFIADATHDYFQLRGHREIGFKGGEIEAASWGMFKLDYLTNAAPTAIVSYRELDTADPTYEFDAGSSSDTDSGLPDQPYRWRFSDDAEWTDWSAAPLDTTSYPDLPGERTVTLEVRDRWRRSNSADVIVSVPAVFPDNRTKLLANFRAAHANLDLDTYRNTLHRDYRFIFQEFDILNLGLPSDRHDRDSDLVMMANMFSGDIAPTSGSAGVTAIEVSLLGQEGSWSDSVHPDFPGASRALFNIEFTVVRPGSHTLTLTGRQEFFISSRLLELPDLTTRTYWEIVGQVDLSDQRAKAIESVTWGQLKWLYR